MKFLKKMKQIFKRKKWVRITSYIVSALLILLIAGIIFIGQIVKGSIQTAGPLILGVPVSVKNVNIRLLGDLRIEVKDLVVGNPQGYSSPHALQMKNFVFCVKTFSLLSDKIIVDKLELTGVEVNYETSLFASNLNDIQNNVKKFTPAGEKESDADVDDAEENAPEESKETKLQVNTIDISDITLRVIFKGGNVAGIPLMMVPIHMKDLGTEPEGITVSGLIEEIFSKLLTGTSEVLTKSGNAVSDGAARTGDKMKGAMKSTEKAVKKASKDIENKFKGLFRSKENKK